MAPKAPRSSYEDPILEETNGHLAGIRLQIGPTQAIKNAEISEKKDEVVLFVPAASMPTELVKLVKAYLGDFAEMGLQNLAELSQLQLLHQSIKDSR